MIKMDADNLKELLGVFEGSNYGFYFENFTTEKINIKLKQNLIVNQQLSNVLKRKMPEVSLFKRYF